MINRTIIRSLARQVAYEKGYNLYYQNNVYDMSVEEVKGMTSIQASVNGSSNQIYVVKLELKNDKVESSYCDCPAYYNYSGICKHCVAVLLKFCAQQERANNRNSMRMAVGRTHEPASMAGTRTPARSASGMQFTDRVPKQTSRLNTSPGMKEILSKQMLQHTFFISQSELCGKVRLEPFIRCSKREISMECKIGITQMYIIRDMFGFTQAIEKQEMLSYGKKLTFYHTMEVFSEESLPLVEFLLDWAAQNKRHFMQSNYFGMVNQVTQKLRTIPLTVIDLEQLLQKLPQKRIAADVNEKGERRFEIIKEKPDIPIRVKGLKDGIRVDTDILLLLKGRKHLLLFQNETINLIPRQEVSSVENFLLYLAKETGQQTFLQKEDIPAFCQELLPDLQKQCSCMLERFKPEDYSMEPVRFEFYLDMPEWDVIVCQLYAVYGEEKKIIFSEDKTDTNRDYVSETMVGKKVNKYFNRYDEVRHRLILREDEELLYELLTEGIPQMRMLGDVYITDAMKRLKVGREPKVSLGVSLSGAMLELSVTSQELSAEEMIQLLAGYDRRRKFYRLQNGEFITVLDGGIEKLAKLQNELHLSSSQMKKGKIQLPKFRAMYLDEELKNGRGFHVDKNAPFLELIYNMSTEEQKCSLPASLEGVLREYQKKGVQWMKTLKRNGFGGILADDMGLGKTLQVIAFLLSEYEDASEEKHCLIVTPASLVYNWQSEIERFAPSLPVTVMVGTVKERQAILEQLPKQAILLTSYDLLKRDSAFYEGKNFFCQILDEAQYIKNHNTRSAHAVKAVSAEFRMALTGTPVENRLSELWSIFDYLMPGFLYPYKWFREELEIPIVQNKEEKAAERLQKMIRPFVLRRLKKDVLTDLPDKLEENVITPLQGEQQKLYDAHVMRLKLLLGEQTEDEFNHSKIQILAELTKLRQICCDPALLYENYLGESAKLQICMDLLHNAVNGGHKILLFSQFTTMLDRLTQHMKQEGISYFLLTGSTPKEKRKQLVEAFNQNDTSVFCISLKAGGTGLNLTAADIVIHYDPWWNIAVQNQATDRAHRIGQENIVTVYKLIVKGTIEENIVRLQEQKRLLANQILGGEGMDSISFNRHELLELLGSGLKG